jgi:hypothetical protein
MVTGINMVDIAYVFDIVCRYPPYSSFVSLFVSVDMWAEMARNHFLKIVSIYNREKQNSYRY